MNEELIEKGKQIVKELGGENQDSLRKWMAHYVAELMEKAHSDNEEEARAASDQCAQIILKVWEMKVQEQIVQVKHEVNSWRNRVYEEDDEHYEKLKHALAEPENFKPLLDTEDGLTIRSLSNYK